MLSRIKPLMLTLLALFLTACGSGISGGSGSQAVSSSNGCITASCHGSLASKVTGRAIASEWKASTHFAANIAGCRTCHGHSHQNSCQNCHGGGSSLNAPADVLVAEEKCLDCHVRPGSLKKGLDGKHLPELNSLYGATSTFSLTQGWNNSTNPPTADNTTAGWMLFTGTKFESKCIWCHNPHDNRVLPQHEQWAESGHGNPAAGYTRSDMKFRGSPGDYRTQVAGESCVRCHTATGFVNWVESGMKDVSAWGIETRFNSLTTSKNKQTLYCIVCHDNGKGKAYGFNLRSIPAEGANGGVRIYQNFSSTVSAAATENAAERFTRLRVLNNALDFPNIAISDRCLLCHSGRGGGQLIKRVAVSKGFDNLSAVNFRKINRIGTHDFAGGGSMFKALGFEYYSSSHYAQPSGIPYIHDQIGQANFAGTGSRGPCVSCHMSSAESHSFMPVTITNGAIASINTSLCSTCHSAGGPGFSRFNGSVADINIKKTGYNAAIRVLNAWLNMKKIASSSNWLRTSTFPGGAAGAALTAAGLGQAACIPPADRSLDVFLGTRNMGASLNKDFLGNEPGGFVHNDLYVKRIIYDSLDWLDNCKMDQSVEAAINLTANATVFPAALFNNTDTDIFNDTVTNADRTSVINYLMGGPGGGRPGGF